MSATPITPSDRYFRLEVSKVIFCTTIANISAITRSEINAGIDLSNEISETSGWQVTGDTADTPALGTTFTAKIPSTTSADDSSLTLWADSTSNDVRTLLPRGTRGYIVWMDEGDVAGHLCDIFPVRVVSAPKQRALNDPSAIMINFSISAKPAENVAIPA